MLADLGTDDTQTTGNPGSTAAHIRLTGHIVKMDPLTIAGCYDTLGAQNHAVLAAIKGCQYFADLFFREFSGCFGTPAGKDLIGMMMVMVMVMIMAAAGAVLVMRMVMMIVIMMAVFMIMVFMVVMAMLVIMVFMVVMAMLVIMMLMVMMIMVVVLMVMIVAAAGAVPVMLMVVVFVVMMSFFQFLQHGIALLHGLQNLGAGQLIPGGGHDHGIGILSLDQLNTGMQLFFGNGIRAAENDRTGSFHLIVIELAEVLHIHLALAGIGHSDHIAQLHIMGYHLLHSGFHITELAYTGGLDEDPVGMILLNDLLQSLTKVAHQRAADAAGVHFGDFNAGLLQKTAVNANFTELILDQHQLLACIGLLDHLFNQSCFTCSEKTGVNIDFSHTETSPSLKKF